MIAKLDLTRGHILEDRRGEVDVERRHGNVVPGLRAAARHDDGTGMAGGIASLESGAIVMIVVRGGVVVDRKAVLMLEMIVAGVRVNVRIRDPSRCRE